MVSVQLNDTIAAGLSAQAAAQGLTLEAYLETVLLSSPSRPASRMSIEELERLLDAEASAGPSPTGSFSRAELYGDHD